VKISNDERTGDLGCRSNRFIMENKVKKWYRSAIQPRLTFRRHDRLIRFWRTERKPNCCRNQVISHSSLFGKGGVGILKKKGKRMSQWKYQITVHQLPSRLKKEKQSNATRPPVFRPRSMSGGGFGWLEEPFSSEGTRAGTGTSGTITRKSFAYGKSRARRGLKGYILSQSKRAVPCLFPNSWNGSLPPRIWLLPVWKVWNWKRGIITPPPPVTLFWTPIASNFPDAEILRKVFRYLRNGGEEAISVRIS